MYRVDRLPKYQTKVRQEGNTTIVKLWYTDIVTFDPFQVTLNHGGWKTETTKRRMNQVSRFFDLGYRVVQRRGDWSVIFLNGRCQSAFLYDSITFPRLYRDEAKTQP